MSLKEFWASLKKKFSSLLEAPKRRNVYWFLVFLSILAAFFVIIYFLAYYEESALRLRGHILVDNWNIPILIALVLFFASLVVVIGGKLGFLSLFGLVVSLAIIFCYIIPGIINGGDALLTCMFGALLILFSSTILSHGFKKRTFIGVASIFIVLLLVVDMSILVTSALNLSGAASEEAVYLKLSNIKINLVDVFIGGVVIVSLGVLDDIAMAQVAIVDELKKVNKKLPFKDTFNKAMSVGREHVASLVNTLALAYVGASLPTAVLLMSSYERSNDSIMLFFNSEFILEDIVRIIVPSAGLLLIVPLSTLMAIYLLPLKYSDVKKRFKKK